MNAHDVFSYSKILAGKTFALFILIFTPSMTAHAASDLATVIKSKGSVMVKVPSTQHFYSLETGDQLPQGSTLKTGDNSMALIKLPKGDIINLKANTELELKELNVLNPGQSNEISTTRLYLNYGDVVSKVNKLVSGSVFQIQTAVGVAGVRGTIFQVSITKEENGRVTMNITTAEGIVVLQNTALDTILATIPASNSVDASVDIDLTTGQINSANINVGENVTITPEQTNQIRREIQSLIIKALTNNENQGGTPGETPIPPKPDMNSIDAATASPK